jgi:hypothetical protein
MSVVSVLRSVTAPAWTTWMPEAVSWVSPLNSATVPVTSTISPGFTSVAPPKMNRPSEVSGLPSWSTTSSCTKKPPRLRAASPSPFWKSPVTIARIVTVCPTMVLAEPEPWTCEIFVTAASSLVITAWAEPWAPTS